MCSGFDRADTWGHRAAEPNKAVICSIALARLRTDIRGDSTTNSNAVGMAQKLLLFWRKPARRCWWEGVELEDVEGVPGTLKVWIRRVWTLEMVSYNHVFAVRNVRFADIPITERYWPPLATRSPSNTNNDNRIISVSWHLNRKSRQCRTSLIVATTPVHATRRHQNCSVQLCEITQHHGFKECVSATMSPQTTTTEGRQNCRPSLDIYPYCLLFLFV